MRVIIVISERTLRERTRYGAGANRPRSGASTARCSIVDCYVVQMWKEIQYHDYRVYLSNYFLLFDLILFVQYIVTIYRTKRVLVLRFFEGSYDLYCIITLNFHVLVSVLPRENYCGIMFYVYNNLSFFLFRYNIT